MLQGGALSSRAWTTPLSLKSLCSRLLSLSQESLPLSSLSHKRLHLWDNWGHYDRFTQSFHRFALAAPKHLSPEDRHFHSHIHHFTSSDGQTWEDQGPLISADFDPQVTTLWSGSSYFDSQSGEWLLYFTGVQDDTLHSQSLWLVRTRDHKTWSSPERLADPYLDSELKNQLLEEGYHLGQEDNIISSFRDPFRKKDRLLFAGKAFDPSGQLRPVVGQLRLNSQGQINRVDSPIFLPLEDKVTQIELPSLVRYSGREYLMVTANNQGQVDGPAPKRMKSQLLLFEASNDGVYAATSYKKAQLVFDQNSGLFSGTPLAYAPKGKLLLFSFRLRALTLSPLIPVY